VSPIGRQGENLACQFLARRGYRIISRNFRGSGGEIDIVAQKDNTLYFIEVKTSASADFGYPEQRITEQKKTRLLRTAREFLKAFPQQDLEKVFSAVSVLRLRGRWHIETFHDII